MRSTEPGGRRNALTRLAAMAAQKLLAGALAVAATAVAISACGSSSSSDQTIDPADANELTSALSGVESAVASGNCKRAETEAVDFVAVVNQLPDTVGTTNKEALRSAGENLQKLAQDPSQCRPSPTGASGLQGDQSTSTSTTTTEAEPTTPTTTTPPGQGNTGGGSTGGGETGGGGSAGGGGGTGSGGTGVGGGGSD